MFPTDFAESKHARYFVIFLHSIPQRTLTPKVVKLHAAHLAELNDEGKLVMAGPLVERSGGLIVLQAVSAAEAIAIAEEDPLVRCTYQTYELGTWLVSNRQNNYRPNIQSATER
jgi:uncharacterized protein YciI